MRSQTEHLDAVRRFAQLMKRAMVRVLQYMPAVTDAHCQSAQPPTRVL